MKPTNETPDENLLLGAYDYFTSQKKSSERFLSYLFKGIDYMLSKDYESAMKELVKAEEDVEFIYRLLPSIKTIGVVKEPFNQYLQREGSITKSIDKRIYHYIDNWNGIVQYYKENNLYEQYYNELEYCYVRYLYATFIKQTTSYDIKEYENAVTTAIENVKKNFPKYRRNKYFTSYFFTYF